MLYGVTPDTARLCGQREQCLFGLVRPFFDGTDCGTTTMTAPFYLALAEGIGTNYAALILLAWVDLSVSSRLFPPLRSGRSPAVVGRRVDPVSRVWKTLP